MRLLAAITGVVLAGCTVDYDVGDIHALHVSPRWALSLGDAWDDQAASIAIDSAGNVIVGGSFQHQTDFGGGMLTSPQHPSCCGDASETIYNSTGFVTKRAAADGSHLWTATLDGVIGGDIRSVGVDGAGNVYAAGMHIDDAVEQMSMVTTAMDSEGVQRWRRELPPESLSSSIAMAVAPDGSSYVVGTFFGTVDFGDGPVHASGLDYWGGTLIVAYDRDGTQRWGRIFGGSGGLTAIALTPEGDLVLSGGVLHSFVVGAYQVEGVGRADAVLVRMSSSGDVEWARLVRPVENDTIGATSLAVEPDGSIVLNGTEQRDNGPNYVATIIFAPNGKTRDASLVRGAYPRRVLADSDGGLLVSGQINDRSADFGNGPSEGRFFIAAYDDHAVPIGAISYTRVVEDVVAGGSFDACASTAAAVAAAGYFEGRVDVGTGTLETPPSDYNILVAVYDREPPPP